MPATGNSDSVTILVATIGIASGYLAALITTLVGTATQRRAERVKWNRDMRKDAYSAYLVAFHAAARDFTWSRSEGYRYTEPGADERRRELQEELARTLGNVKLLASDRATDLAEAMYFSILGTGFGFGTDLDTLP